MVFYSLTTLHNILQHQGDEAKRAVRLAGGVQKMVDLLSKDNAQLRFLALLADCLEMLAFQHQESKLIIVSKHGTQQLVRLLQMHRNYEKLLFTICRLLKVLSVETSNKQVIIECNGMNVLGNMLEHPSSRCVKIGTRFSRLTHPSLKKPSNHQGATFILLFHWTSYSAKEVRLADR